jgi:flagellar motor switch protein FliG
VQALLVLNMPEDSRVEYVKSLDIDKKKRIVKQSLNLDEVEVKDLEVLSETVKSTVNSSQKTGRKLSMLPMSTQLLESLTVLEEMRVLREITSGLRDQGRRLKKTYPTLAFIDEWNADSLKLLLERLQPDHVVTLIRQIPQAKDHIIKNLMPRTAEIVNDDLKMPDTTKESDIESKLGIARGILRSMVQGGFIDIEQAYATTEAGNNAKAA